jgi:small subunit ribosomal protein S20
LPRIASAAKHLRKSRAAAIRNRAQRSELRTALKKAGTASASVVDRKRAIQLLDRAARKGLIHRNAAGRYKGRLDAAMK